MSPHGDGRVVSVTGSLEADALGRTLMHEHLLTTTLPQPGMSLRDERLAGLELADARAGGTTTLVDLTTFDLGRRPAALRRLSEASGVNVVMGTGWYTSATYPHRIATTSTADLAAELIADIRDGVDGIRPGVIGEIGTAGLDIDAREERVVRAVARAHAATGLAIFVHQQRVYSGPAVLDLLTEEGVTPGRVVFCHMDALDEPGAHEDALERGVWLSYDRPQGWELVHQMQTWEIDHRVDLVVRARALGALERVLLSTDCCVLGDLARYGGPGYAYTHTGFATRLRDAGLTEADLDTLFVANPRRLLPPSDGGPPVS